MPNSVKYFSILTQETGIRLNHSASLSQKSSQYNNLLCMYVFQINRCQYFVCICVTMIIINYHLVLSQHTSIINLFLNHESTTDAHTFFIYALHQNKPCNVAVAVRRIHISYHHMHRYATRQVFFTISISKMRFGYKYQTKPLQ